MKKEKIILAALLAFMLTLNISKVNSEQSSLNDPGNKQSTKETAKSFNAEEFKQELEKFSSNDPIISDTNHGHFKAKVKTLSGKYLLSPGDTIAVFVYGEPEFTQPTILVRPDGGATIEPFGEINVAGLSTDEMTKELTKKYKAYLLDPKVIVKLDNLHPAKVYIHGAIQKPGLYQQERIVNRQSATGREILTTPELTVASVIANAGGIDYNADLQHVKIVNNQAGMSEEVNLMRLIKDGDASQDIFLRSGDSVYIPYRESDAQISDNDFLLVASSSIAPTSFPVRVIGAVNRPGVHMLSSDSPRLNSAIASSEGYQLYANKKVLAIHRITPKGNISKFYVNPNKSDLILRPNDIVVVQDKSTELTTRGFNFLSSLISPFGVFAGAYNGWGEMLNPSKYN